MLVLGRAAFVAMMEPTNFRQGYDFSFDRSAYGAGFRGIFAQA